MCYQVSLMKLIFAGSAEPPQFREEVLLQPGEGELPLVTPQTRHSAAQRLFFLSHLLRNEIFWVVFVLLPVQILLQSLCQPLHQNLPNGN